MKFLFHLVLFFVGLWLFGMLALATCTPVRGADLQELPCTPVVSNGDENPHYTNTWNACSQRCARAGHQDPEVDLRTCACRCR